MARVGQILFIADSDSVGSAGIQADIKTASALGIYTGVQSVTVLAAAMVAAQIALVLDDIRVDALKTRMLADLALIAAFVEAMSGFDGPVVIDPVIVVKSGDALLAYNAVAALRAHLLPRATVLTPHLPDAALPEAVRRAQHRLHGAIAAADRLDVGHGHGSVHHFHELWA